MFVQRDATGTVIGWGPTVRTPDGVLWDDPQVPPSGWVWEEAFSGPSQETFDFATQLAAQQALIDELLAALGGGGNG
jgi:hypothetical protein